MRKQEILSVLIVFFGLAPAAAQETPPPTVNELVRLIADDGESGDHFGDQVALEGDTALIGAEVNDEDPLFNVGAVYVFEREGDEWIERQKLLPSDAVGGELFGSAIAVDGDTAVIAARGRRDEDGNINVGGVYVFTRTGGVWVEQQVLVPTNGLAETQFGNAVDLDGDTLVVGWSNDVSLGFFSGSAFVYTRSNGIWSEAQQLLADDGESGDLFGAAVGVEGDTVFVGSGLTDSPVATNAGAVYTFVRDGQTWNQQQKLFASDAGGFFGRRLAVDGETLVVGAELGDTAYVFEREGELWSERQLLRPTGAFPASFASSVAVEGDTIVVGDRRGQDGELFARGSAHVYLRGTDGWVEEFVLHAADIPSNEFFGDVVALSGDVFLVGAQAASHNGTTSTEGAAFVFAPVVEEDLEGPRILDASLSPNPAGLHACVNLTAVVDDSETGGATIAGAEVALDGGAFQPLAAVDGAFDAVTEDLAELFTTLPEGLHEICLRGTDALGNVGSETCLTLVVDGQAPTVADVRVTPEPLALGATAVLTASVSDVTSGALPIRLVDYSFDEEKAEPMLAVDGLLDSPAEDVTANIGPFPAPGVYEVIVSARDAALNGAAASTLVTVFEPRGSFLAAGGTLESADGRAELGLVARYRRGSLTPQGRTEFRFTRGALDFRSTSAAVKKIAGSEARVGGTGTVGGAGRYGFLVTLRDGDHGRGGVPDAVRVRIWNLDTGAPLIETAALAPLSSGSAVIRD